MTQDQRLMNAHACIDRVRPFHALAVELLALTRDELIAKVREDHETFGDMLLDFTEAVGDARAILELCSSAEIRLACAVANVELGADATGR
jgi:hypothetical protein